jgi:hypothetical protein
MKKLLFLILGLSNVALADSGQVILFNMSQNNIMDVTYRICTTDTQYNESCDRDITVSINVKKSPGDKNYITINQEGKIPPNTKAITVHLISATEKDSMGNIVAKGKYFRNRYASTCSPNLYYKEDQLSHLGLDSSFAFDDMHQSPYITCIPSALDISSQG